MRFGIKPTTSTEYRSNAWVDPARLVQALLRLRQIRKVLPQEAEARFRAADRPNSSIAGKLERSGKSRLSPALLLMAHSENELQRKLHDSWVVGTGDLAENVAAHRRVGISASEAVGHVIGFDSSF